MLERLIKWDTDLFLFLNGFHNDFGDTIMYWSSEKLTWIPLYMIFLYFIIKTYKWKSLWILLVIALLITFTDQLSVHLFKNIFHRFRPCHEPALEGMVHLVNNKCGGEYGFISSHAANHFAIATFLSMLFITKNKYIPFLLFLWALEISYSRIYLGVHYPGDVIVGAIFGILSGYAFWKFIPRFTKNK